MSDHPGRRDQRPKRYTSEGDTDRLAQFGAYLEQRGHSPRTAQAYRHAVVHFLRWWQTQEPPRRALLRPESVQTFLDEHVPECTCPAPVVRSPRTLRAALNQWLAMSGQPRSTRPPTPMAEAIADSVRDFDRYLNDVCALAAETRRSRCRYVAQFLDRVFGTGPVQADCLTASVLMDAVSAWATEVRPCVAIVMVGALRSYLRFLRWEGQLSEDLAVALPAPAHWRLTNVPTALSAAELDRFLAVFDCATAIGQRDYAMARCLADLGLRCNEVAALTLEAIDWRAGVVTLSHTKNHRCDQLPLPSATGEALVAYLHQGRPMCSTRAVFVHHRAPVGAAVAKTTVRGAVRRAFQRAGLPWSGTHVLRHTAARRMLQGGCSLKDIADVLRHRSLDTTAIYAKVDLPHLAQVALPWPEVRP
jgi:site-specific recombinase XerD